MCRRLTASSWTDAYKVRQGQTTWTRRPTRRVRLMVWRPFLVFIRARKPILRARLMLLAQNLVLQRTVTLPYTVNGGRDPPFLSFL